MFQEGLYQVYFRETPPPRPLPQATNQGELNDVRIHRWFGTVVNTRLLVTGVRCCFLMLMEVSCYCSSGPSEPSALYLPSGGAGPLCLSLYTNHSHPHMRELQLFSLHDDTGVV